MMPQSFTLAILAFVVFLLSLAGTAVVRRIARAYGWIARPRPDRWHIRSTALHGGVGFFPVFFIGGCLTLLWATGSSWRGWESLDGIPQELALTGALLLGSLLMFGFGLWDDVWDLRPATKFVGQLVAASLFIFAGGTFPLTGNPVLDMLVTYFWFVGITNAVNMLDNMDGLASGVVILCGATLVGLTLGAHGFRWEDEIAVPLGLIFVAALAGFWCFNRPPATIFMGDSGSLASGYLMAALSVPSPLNGSLGLSAHGGLYTPVLGLVIPVAVLAIPIFDTTLVTLTRKWHAQPASQGGRDHSSHRLVGLGLSESTAVWVLYNLSAIGGFLAVLIQQFPDKALPLFGVFLAVLFISGVYLGHVKVRVADPAKPPPAWTPLVTHLLYKRRAAEVLLDMILIIVCYYSAFLLRFEGQLPMDTTSAVLRALPLVVASCLIALFLAAIYRHQWGLIGIADLPKYLLAVFGGTFLSLAVVTLVTRFEAGQSRSAYIIFGLLLLLAMVGTRLSFRLLDSLIYHRRGNRMHRARIPVLIYGAGRSGKLAYDEIMAQAGLQQYKVVGFVDDDPYQEGRALCGLRVMAPARWAQEAIAPPFEIWVSSRSISDTRAQLLARWWSGRVLVRRLRVVVDLLPDEANSPTPSPLTHMRLTPIPAAHDPAPPITPGL